MLYTKYILSPRYPFSLSDEYRISVMSRHTLNDGVTPDKRIMLGVNYDDWKKIFSPPSKLIEDYYKRDLEWGEFELRYLEYLREDHISRAVAVLAVTSLNQNNTLLGIEKTAKNCHRRLLAEECQRHYPHLEVRHI